MVGGDDLAAIVARGVGRFAREVSEIEEARRNFPSAAGVAHTVFKNGGYGGAIEVEQLLVIDKLAEAA